MEIGYIILIIIFSSLLGCYMATLWLNKEVQQLKAMRYGDIKGIMIRDDKIAKLKAEINELKNELNPIQHQNRKEEDNNKSIIND